MTGDVLDRLEVYYDAAPRAAARVEELGPFVLFVKREDGWDYYARPRLGADVITAGDVERVRTRQRELGVPEAFEWVAATTPGLAEAARATGLAVHEHPLMVLAEEDRSAAPDGIAIRMLDPDEPAVGTVNSAIGAAFTGSDDVEEQPTPEFVRGLLREGLLRTAGAFEQERVLGGGSHQPRGDVSELVGIGVLPRARRRGLGAAITAVLVSDARRLGVRTVFLSAADQ